MCVQAMEPEGILADRCFEHRLHWLCNVVYTCKCFYPRLACIYSTPTWVTSMGRYRHTDCRASCSVRKVRCICKLFLPRSGRSWRGGCPVLLLEVTPALVFVSLTCDSLLVPQCSLCPSHSTGAMPQKYNDSLVVALAQMRCPKVENSAQTLVQLVLNQCAHQGLHSLRWDLRWSNSFAC